MNREGKRREQAARAAWMYYVAGLTQQDIAKTLGISRQAAQRLIYTARDLGMVSVQIAHPISGCLQLAERLSQQFSLKLCHITPSANLNHDAIQQMLATEGARVMTQFINEESPQVFGVGSGKTLRAVIDALPAIERPQHHCVAMIGAISRDDSGTRYDVPLRLAEKMQGKYFFIPAPLYADNKEDKITWCQHPVYQRVVNRALHASATFLGIGEVTAGCPLHTEGFITDRQVQDLQKKGVAGEMLGHFFDQQGKRIDCELDPLLTSVPLHCDQSRLIVGLAGGDKKFSAIRAALRGKWVNGLVTDEATAIQLLE